MLKGISPLVSPDLLKALCEMGHGDEIIISDGALMAKVHALVPPEKIEHVERFAFYERARKVFAVVVTGETAKYGNILLKKGVTPLA